MVRSFSALALGFLVSLGCGPSSQLDDISGPGADDDPGSDPGDDGPTAPPDAGSCGAQQEEIELVNLGEPPDVLIVLDRSGSMDSQPPPPFGTFPDPFAPTKWEIMETALTDLTNNQQDNINFGLLLFPTDESCGVSAGALVDPAPASASAVQGELSGWDPGGSTPAETALIEARSVYASLPVNPEGRYVIFATDGAPNCTSPADQGTIDAVAGLAADGVGTFVLGFGGAFSEDEDVLNDSAIAGGHPKAGGPPYFYKADDAAELDAALAAIAGGIVTPSCSYELAEVPPEPDNVTVLADGTPVPRSTSQSNGWDYYPDESTITFFGSYCTDIETGAISSVEFIFGCQGPQVD